MIQKVLVRTRKENLLFSGVRTRNCGLRECRSGFFVKKEYNGYMGMRRLFIIRKDLHLSAGKLGLDEDEIINMKMTMNEAKYPVEKAKGSNKKYTEL